MLVARFGGRVPGTLEELVTLPGVGRKTANLVLILAFKSRAEHLRRYPRASDLESSRLGADTEIRRKPSRRCIGDGPAVVAGDQPVSGDVGSERLPAGASAVRGLRDRTTLPKNWR